MMLCSQVALLSFWLASFPFAPMDGQELVPCESAAIMTSMDAALMMRVTDHLCGYRDEPVLLARILVLPDFSPGIADQPAEWALSIYLSPDGSGLLELAQADESIRGKNTKWVRAGGGTKISELTRRTMKVPISKHKRPINRDLAIKLRRFIERYVLNARFDGDNEISVFVHSTSYLFMVRSGPMICGQLPSTGESGDEHPLGDLVEMLRAAAVADGDGLFESLSNIEKLLGNVGTNTP